MKKAISLIIVTFSFSYELAVLNIYKQKLQEHNIKCVTKGNVCIFFKGKDKQQAEKVKNYLLRKYGIFSFYMPNAKKLNKIMHKNLVRASKEFNETVKKDCLPDKPLKHIYSYQIASTKDLKKAKEILKKYEHLPQIRIEKIGEFYVIRYGIFKKMPKKNPKFFITKCYFIPQRVVK